MKSVESMYGDHEAIMILLENEVGYCEFTLDGDSVEGGTLALGQKGDNAVLILMGGILDTVYFEVKLENIVHYTRNDEPVVNKENPEDTGILRCYEVQFLDDCDEKYTHFFTFRECEVI